LFHIKQESLIKKWAKSRASCTTFPRGEIWFHPIIIFQRFNTGFAKFSDCLLGL